MQCSDRDASIWLWLANPYLFSFLSNKIASSHITCTFDTINGEVLLRDVPNVKVKFSINYFSEMSSITSFLTSYHSSISILDEIINFPNQTLDACFPLELDRPDLDDNFFNEAGDCELNVHDYLITFTSKSGVLRLNLISQRIEMEILNKAYYFPKTIKMNSKSIFLRFAALHILVPSYNIALHMYSANLCQIADSLNCSPSNFRLDAIMKLTGVSIPLNNEPVTTMFLNWQISTIIGLSDEIPLHLCLRTFAHYPIEFTREFFIYPYLPIHEIMDYTPLTYSSSSTTTSDSTTHGNIKNDFAEIKVICRTPSAINKNDVFEIKNVKPDQNNPIFSWTSVWPYRESNLDSISIPSSSSERADRIEDFMMWEGIYSQPDDPLEEVTPPLDIPSNRDIEFISIATCAIKDTSLFSTTLAISQPLWFYDASDDIPVFAASNLNLILESNSLNNKIKSSSLRINDNSKGTEFTQSYSVGSGLTDELFIVEEFPIVNNFIVKRLIPNVPNCESFYYDSLLPSYPDKPVLSPDNDEVKNEDYNSDILSDDGDYDIEQQQQQQQHDTTSETGNTNHDTDANTDGQIDDNQILPITSSTARYTNSVKNALKRCGGAIGAYKFDNSRVISRALQRIADVVQFCPIRIMQHIIGRSEWRDCDSLKSGVFEHILKKNTNQENNVGLENLGAEVYTHEQLTSKSADGKTMRTGEWVYGWSNSFLMEDRTGQGHLKLSIDFRLFLKDLTVPSATEALVRIDGTATLSSRMPFAWCAAYVGVNINSHLERVRNVDGSRCNQSRTNSSSLSLPTCFAEGICGIIGNARGGLVIESDSVSEFKGGLVEEVLFRSTVCPFMTVRILRNDKDGQEANHDDGDGGSGGGMYPTFDLRAKKLVWDVIVDCDDDWVNTEKLNRAQGLEEKYDLKIQRILSYTDQINDSNEDVTQFIRILVFSALLLVMVVSFIFTSIWWRRNHNQRLLAMKVKNNLLNTQNTNFDDELSGDDVIHESDSFSSENNYQDHLLQDNLEKKN